MPVRRRGAEPLACDVRIVQPTKCMASTGDIVLGNGSTLMTRSAMLLVSMLLSIMPLAARAQIAPVVPLDAASDRQRAIGCLATAIAYEAGYEPTEGQQAVAEVILNRLRHAGYPKSVCGVVFSGSTRRTGCQFSFTCDGSLNRRLSATVMENTRLIAAAALDGLNPSRVPGATHYHADYVSPYWAPSLIRIAKLGAHIFYRGAGTRDQDNRSRAYTPFGEPLVPGADNAAAIFTTSEATARPVAGRTPARPATVFAPWGLPPGDFPRPD